MREAGVVETLIEREAEVETLRAAIAAAAAGAGETVVVDGPPGIGKSAVLDRAAPASAGNGIRVLSASGSELEREVAFGVVRQLFERAVRDLPEPKRREVLQGAAGLALPVLEPSAGGGSHTDHAGLHGLYWLAVQLAATTPLVLVVDDAHLADELSLRWIGYLARRLETEPISLLLAARSDDHGERLLAQVLAEMPGHRCTLRPLTRAGVEAWLRRVHGEGASERFVDECLAATGGNPFLLRELVSALRADGRGPDDAAAANVAGTSTAAISRRVLLTLAAIGDDAIAVAEAASVLPSEADLGAIAAIAEVALADVATAADRLVAADVFTDGSPPAFRHPIQRAAVYEQIPPARRAMLHLAAAERIDAAGRPERAAPHLLHAPAGGREWVVRSLRRAAADARSRGAPDVAVRYLRRADAEGTGTDAELLLELAEAEAAAGSAAAAERYAAARRAGDPSIAARTAIAEAGVRAVRGDGDAAVGLLERMLETTPPGPAAAMLESSLLSVAQVFLPLRPRIAGRLAELVGSEPDTATPEGRALAAALALEVLVAGDADRAAGLAEASLGGERLVADVGIESPLIGVAINTLTFCDRFEEARGHWEVVLAEARRRGSAVAYGSASTFLGFCRLRAGELRDAEADLRAGATTLRDLGILVPAAIAVGFLAETLAERGEGIAAQRELEAWSSELDSPFSHTLLYSYGRVLLTLGRHEEALAALELHGRRSVEWQVDASAIYPWRSDAAVAGHALGDHAAARARSEHALAAADHAGTRRARGLAWRAFGLTRSGPEALAALRRAAEELDRTAARLDRARCTIDLGVALNRAGKRTAARSALRTGLDLADRCGAEPLCARAREELHILGARPRRERLSGPEALTASERRVAEMAARGLTNRQIAQALFVTTKTVEMHLAHAYPKLGIRGRGELVAALGDDPGAGGRNSGATTLS